MEDKLFEKLDGLNIKDIDLLLNKNIDLSLNYSVRKRIEQSVKKKTGYYSDNNLFKDKINNFFGGIFMKRKIALAASVAMVLSLGGGVYAYAKTPVAYVSLDINPSVELGVNAFDTVVSAEAYNEDGEKVLEGTDLINSKVDDAVSTVITNAISDGYIKEDGTSAIEITTSTDKDNVATELDESLQEVADKTLEDNNVEAEVETDKVALARRDEARQLGITPGKLNLIQKLQSLDPTIKIEDYKAISVKDIQKKTKELRKMNKSGEVTTTDSGTNADTSTNENTNSSTDTTGVGTSTGTNTNTDVTNEENTQQDATLSKSSVDTEKATITQPEKNNNSSNDKNNNGSMKKEENSNANAAKVESNGNKEEKTATASDKKNDSNQGNSDSSKSEKSSNGNSNSQSKGKSKNN